ncbi:MAG: CBS domain-containing protein [Myxococcota bacterium]
MSQSVREVMDSDPVRIGPDVYVRDALQLMLRERLRHLTVVDEDDEVLGLISDRDLRHLLPDPRSAPERFSEVQSATELRSVMTRNPATIEEGASVSEAVRRFRERRLEVMPVLSDQRLVGMLTQAHLMGLLLSFLKHEPAPKPEKPSPAHSDTRSVGTPTTRVLIIEDDFVTRRILCHHLERSGHEVTQCEDGGSAAELLERQTYDLILTDINLPRVSGLGLLDSFNGRLAGTKKIVMSASHRDDMILQAFRLGADDFIKKPFNPEILMCRVNRLLVKA